MANSMPTQTPLRVRALGGAIGGPRGRIGVDGRIGEIGPDPDDRSSSQGMISPREFVEVPSGDLTAISFRFLNSVFNCIRYLEADVEALEARLDAAGIPGMTGHETP